MLSPPSLLEKSPPNLLRTRFLQALFPDAAFVVVIRHPSPSRRDPKGRAGCCRYGALVDHWVAATALLAGDAPYVRGLHVIRYEQLVGDPDAVLAAVFAVPSAWRRARRAIRSRPERRALLPAWRGAPNPMRRLTAT